MNQRIDDQLFDRRLAAWLAEDAGARSPDYLDETLQRLDGVGQRRAWANLERWLPMTVITARSVGAPWRLAWTAFVLALVTLIVASVVIVGSLVRRSNDADPTLQALVPTLQLEETWDPATIDGLDEPMVGDVDADGNVYLVNGATNEVLVLDPSGEVVTRYGSGADGPDFDFVNHPEDPYGFSSAGSVAVAPDGTIYVASIVDRRIHRSTESGDWTAWGGVGSADGQFLNPSKVAVSPDGTVHVRDGQRKDIQRFAPDGTYLDKITVRDAPDGTKLWTGFITFDSDGGSYVAVYDQDRLQSWAPDGTLRWAVEVRGTSDDEFTHPRDVAVDAHGNVFVTHTSVQVFSPEGRLLAEWIPPGEPTEVGMGPLHVATGPDDTVYVSVQMLDTIHKLSVVMEEGEALGASPGTIGAADVAASPEETAAAVDAPAGQAPLLTIPVDEFAVPFQLELPQGSWGVQRVGPGVFQAVTSRPASGGDPAEVHAYVVRDVFSDPCHPDASRMDPPPGPSVDDLIDALTRLEGFRVIDVRDVEIDGHAGTAIRLENSLDASTCDAALWLPQWTYPGASGLPVKHGPPGETLQDVVVLDVDGQRVVLETWTFPNSSRETVAEAERVLESIDFR